MQRRITTLWMSCLALLFLSCLAACAAEPAAVVAATPIPSNAPTPVVTTTALPTATHTPTSTATALPTSTSTATPQPTATSTVTLTPTPTTTATLDFILWDEAAQHVGEQTTICGPVMDGRYATTSRGKPTFLNLGEKYPNPSRFTVLIWGEDRAKFTEKPETLYQNHTICVTGKIEKYQGSFEIVVSEPEQIEIRD